jgi:hypothetical protein
MKSYIPKYKYKTICESIDFIDSKLNRLAHDGWEVVFQSTCVTNSSYIKITYTLKKLIE